MVLDLHLIWLQINAHDGRVNDLAFDHRDKELYLITCGDDKLIKVDSEFSSQDTI